MKKCMFPHPTHYPTELAYIAIEAAIQIDYIINNKNHGLEYIRRFTKKIQKYNLKGTENLSDIYFNTTYQALMRSSKKDIEQVDELALELKLLNMELKDMETLSKHRLKNLKEFLIKFSKHDLKEIRRPYPSNSNIKF